MKTIFVCLICGCWLLVSATAQSLASVSQQIKQPAWYFHFRAIRHVDRGTKSILVQQVKEADNILLVKASEKNFSKTNLSVVTDDGSVYTFVINYEEKPAIWVYNLPENKKATMATYANAIMDNQRTLRGVRDNSWDIDAAVIGTYIKDDIIYYQIRIKNSSPIDYDIDFLRFYIRDKKKIKRTAIQENELKPLYVAGNNKQVKAYQKNTLVFALEKFTIPDAKYYLLYR